MRISTRTRYGTRMMVRLGMVFGRKPVFLKTIAKSEDISEKYLSQIILPLKAAGLVIAFRGSHGGYSLAKHPSLIKMNDIFKVLEGDIEIVECGKEYAGCDRSSSCVTRDLWLSISGNIEKMLAEITLNDMIMKSREKEQATVMYNI